MRTVSRRSFLKGAAGGALAVGSPAVITSAQAQSRVIYVNTWGGSWTAAEDAAFFKPFTKETGITVRTVAPVSYAKLKAQVQSKNYEWDVTAISEADWLRAENEGLVEPIDWSVVDKSKLFDDPVSANGIKYCALGTNLVYRTDKFPKGGPKNWADFWDVQKFPGNRSLFNHPMRTLIFALLADGVPKDKLFPLDLERGFRKLNQIKPHIKVWWTQGNQSQQLLRDGEVDMMAMWNARGSELKQQGLPVEVVWDGATVHTTMWGVVKGHPVRGPARAPGRVRGAPVLWPVEPGRLQVSHPGGVAAAPDLPREPEAGGPAAPRLGSGQCRGGAGALHPVACLLRAAIDRPARPVTPVCAAGAYLMPQGSSAASLRKLPGGGAALRGGWPGGHGEWLPSPQ
jgi:putative spermidine/putrescine transport system substrate-binding protein